MLFQSKPRRTKVFLAALISIGIAAVILKALGGNPPLAGAFSLSDYYCLVPIEKVISSNIVGPSGRWACIDISYSGTSTGDTDQSSSLSSLVNDDVLNYHFIVCNGLIGGDGQIQPTWKWQRQKSAIPARTTYGSEQTIYIRVITRGKIPSPTDFQIRRTEALVEALVRRFDIQSGSIYYPDNWW